LEPGQKKEVSFTYRIEEAGKYTFRIGELARTIKWTG